MLFLEKLRNNTLIILKELMYSKIATKNLLTLMKTFKVEQQRTLVLFESNSNEFTTIMLKSGRNIPNLTVSRLTELKHYDIVKAKSVIMTEAV
jgi:ribosomal protein L4